VRVLPFAIAALTLAAPVSAVAKPKPKIALAPLDGDAGGKIAQAITAALGKDFVVVTAKDARKRTGVVATIDGTLGKAGKKRSLHLELHRRGKPDAGFTIEFKLATSDGFRRGVHDEIVKKLDDAGDEPTEDADKPVAKADREDDAPPPAKHRLADDDPPKKARPAEPAAEDATPAPSRGKKRVAADVEATTDDRAPADKVTHTLGKDAPAAQVLARADAGASVSQRRLSWGTRAGLTPAQTPPGVVTSAGGGRIDGEIYPFALADPKSGVAGLGFAAAYDKSFGLGIKVPNTNVTAPIDQAHYALGARYRIAVGAGSSIAFGLDYFGRTYIADRGGLAMPTTLDTPDFSYKAASPVIAARTPLSSTITLFGVVDGLLMLDAGPAVKNDSYGPASVYGVELHTGLDIAFTPQIGLRITAEYSQINLSFGGKGTMATNRDGDPASQDVMTATDRSIGVAATLGLTY
jgi:hypothetical protein